MVKQHGSSDSIRNKSKQELNNNTRVVYRTVLDNPLNVNWPSLSSPIRNLILEALITFLNSKIEENEFTISDWRLQEHSRKRGRIHDSGSKGKEKELNEIDENGKRKRNENDEVGKKSKKSKSTVAGNNEDMDTTTTSLSTPTTSTPLVLDETTSHNLKLRSEKSYSIPNFNLKPPPPPKMSPEPLPRPKLLDHFCVGINEVTRSLENRIRLGRTELGDPNALPVASSSKVVIKTNEEKEEKKKGRKRHHKISIVKTAIELPTKPTPTKLNFLHPTSQKTLQRPSFQFLSQPLPNTKASLPAYLLPPTDPNPFFFNQLQEHSKTLINATKFDVTRAEYRKMFLEDVMIQDDPVGDRLGRVKARKPVQEGGGKKKKEAKVLKNKVAQEATNNSENGLLKKSPIDLKLADSDALMYASLAAYLAEAKAAYALSTEEVVEPQLIESAPPLLLDLIFVCRPDINPPSLVAHLPTMIAAANGVNQALEQFNSNLEQEKEKEVAVEQMEVEGEVEAEAEGEKDKSQYGNVFLIPFDIGAEKRLADALALRRVTTVAVSSTAPGIEPLLALIHKHITPLTAPWLVPHITNLPSSTSPSSSSNPVEIPPQILIPTHIKHLKSTAPLDLKASLVKKKKAKKLKKMRGRGEIYIAED